MVGQGKGSGVEEAGHAHLWEEHSRQRVPRPRVGGPQGS